MLHELLSNNRSELISRCRAKAAKRFAPSEVPTEADHGVPIFLEQVVDTLRLEQQTTIREEEIVLPAPAPTKIGRSAALHGSEMLHLGYSVDQVVHSYGDVCQSITELAVEQNAGVTADEFRTLNRCLDNAIADAVAAYASGGQASDKARGEDQNERLAEFSTAHDKMVEQAIKSYAAVQTGAIGPTGATGTAHRNLLLLLRSLTRQFVNQARVASEQAPQPPYPKAPSAR